MKAAAMGVPFIATRSMLGTDTLAYSAAKVVEDPFTGLKVCLLPALILDVGLIHVHRADRFGNAQIDGISGFAAEMARASKRLIISAEEIVRRKKSQTTRQNHHPVLPGGCCRARAVRLVSGRDGLRLRARRNCRPRMGGGEQDARRRAGLPDKYIHGVNDHVEYLALIGQKRLTQMVAERERRE